MFRIINLINEVNINLCLILKFTLSITTHKKILKIIEIKIKIFIYLLFTCFSLEAILHMYVNKINSPPMKIKNIIYEKIDKLNIQ